MSLVNNMDSSCHLPSRMEAALLQNLHESYRIVTADVPKIKDHELLAKVHAAGFCHSDYQVIKGEAECKLPLIPSHEGAGVVVQVGKDCDESWKLGDRIGALNSKNACAKCPSCLLKLRCHGCLDPRFCENRETAGFKHDGCLAGYMVVDPAAAVHLPDEISFEQAAPLMCAGATIWGALEKATADLEPGAAVAIVGIGGLGHLGIQFSKSLGFRTIAIDRRPPALNLASMVPPALTPNLIVDSTSSDAQQQIFDFTEGEGVAAAIVCTDSVEATSWALNLLRVGGTLVSLGLPPEQLRFDSTALVFRELNIRGSYVANRESVARMMQVVEEMGVKSALTVVPFDRASELVDVYEAESFKGKIVVTLSG
ncbi:alcohol dehydrogenase GroES-like domain-containing protein [Stachybotrys elegans]|uniref:Alcohol dehydrogenase GroES-like domain-containing protein n=1 Tax=Stachybotrys elegans TaxID=80388 RepID=A0A8K0WS00_9HYPO|nr:alcohol dehydrogenase GroES-like domain-containing protein [Stachybotrys elegans]